MSQITIKDMLDAGVHFGHQVEKWNPKMQPYVYTERKGIHIINLQKTMAATKTASDFVKDIAAQGGKMIFVGTKKQAIEIVKAEAARCEQFHVTKRWLGGTLTNFATIKLSIDRMRRLEQMKEKGEFSRYAKKEQFKMEKEYKKLLEYLEGIRDMKAVPKAMFIVDINKEHIAVKEAIKLNIPIVAITDTNTDPNLVNHPIPGNDDAIKSIQIFTKMIADSYLEGAKNYKAEKAIEDRKESAKDAKKDGKSSDGPDVVKVKKGRKLVAVGTAENLEIEMELEKSKGDKDGSEEN